ncbi:MAG: NUDIX domain-containing protein [Candidatus Kapaibacterium sp.]
MKTRNQARGIVLNSRGEMLFVKHKDSLPADPNQPDRLEYWVPPGGGLEDGETYEEAAVREVFEETGLRVEGSSRHVHTLEKPLMFGGELRLMHAQYYLIFHSGKSCDVMNGDPDEGIKEVRWWSLENCEGSGEIFLPDGIFDIFRSVLAEVSSHTGEQI